MYRSFVPGRNVIRNGLRRPYATIRWRIGSALPVAGLPAAAAPVAGFSRRTAPFRTAVSLAARRKLWDRSAPPSAVGGGHRPADRPGGSPHGFIGVTGVSGSVPPFWP